MTEISINLYQFAPTFLLKLFDGGLEPNDFEYPMLPAVASRFVEPEYSQVSSLETS